MNGAMVSSPRPAGQTVALVSSQADGTWLATWTDETPELSMREDRLNLEDAKRYVEREWGTLR
jgi:hypothetical protein